MTGNAGERLFEAIGQIPDEMVLEAAQEHPDREEADKQAVQTGAAQKETDADTGMDKDKDKDAKRQRRKISAARLSGYLKYLPAAACLCIALGGAGYVVNNFIHMNDSAGIHLSGSFDGGAADGAQEEMDMAMDDAVSEEKSEETAEMDENAQQYDTNEAGSMPEDEYSGSGQLLPVRYDAYEGPVFPLTATGDTQKLKVSRSLKGVIDTEGGGKGIQPLLHVTDIYKIKNTSSEDKTLQLVYPFVTTLNRAYDMDDSILQIEGEEPSAVTYSVGGSISAYRDIDSQEPASMEDYKQIFSGRTEYQERALEKEADWDKMVWVYTFSNFQTQPETDAGNQAGVIGVTIKGGHADVLTYGFDHSFTTEEDSTNYCFFLPKEQKKRILVAAGEQDGEPELGYYANLDCEERIEGIQCEMSREEMSYADALRLCSNEAARKLRQDYEQGMYDAQLPEYMNEDTAFAALTLVSGEDAFYDTLMQRYQSTELTEIFERLFGETRVAYAMTTVTIPAKQSVQAAVHIQKRQIAGNYILPAENENDTNDAVRYDFFSGAQSRLQIEKTSLRLKFMDGWQLIDQNMDLKQKQEQIWKGELQERDYYFMVE